MTDGTTEPKRGESGSWWTTLQGVLTAVAALLTAVGGLIVALYQVHILPWSVPSPPLPLPNPTISHEGLRSKVEGVEVKIFDVRRTREGDATLVQLYYSVTTGPDFYRHDPDHFVRLVLDGTAVAPEWTSAWATNLPPNSVQDIAVKFRLPPTLQQSVVFRFGEKDHILLTAAVSDRN
jgi:hypothetical protein